ncbi:MAG: hypothetical protein ACI8WT_000750 [Clostridium sp.]|jgi:hypothetical protein
MGEVKSNIRKNLSKFLVFSMVFVSIGNSINIPRVGALQKIKYKTVSFTESPGVSKSKTIDQV